MRDNLRFSLIGCRQSRPSQAWASSLLLFPSLQISGRNF